MNAEEHLDKERHILRKWMGRFGANEGHIIWFVYDRTIGFRKTWERITLDQFEHGVWSNKGDNIIPGTGATRATIVKCISALTGDKFRDEEGRTPLVRRREPNDQIYYALEFKYKVPPHMLPIPKRLKPQKPGLDSKLDWFNNSTTDGSKTKLGVVQKLAPNRENRIERKNREILRGDDSCESVAAKIDRIKAGTVAKRVLKAKKGLNPASNVEALFALWKATLLDLYPRVPVLPWTIREKGMISTLRKKWLGAGNAKGTFGEFLKWCLTEWGPMMHYAFPTKSSYRMNAPESPRLGILVVNVRLFIEHYHGGHIEAAKKENSVSNLARRERQLQELDEKVKGREARAREAAEDLRAIKREKRLAVHKRGADSNLVKPEDLGVKAKVANLDQYLDRYER